MKRVQSTRPVRTPHGVARSVATAVSALLLAFALAACTPPQQYPDGVTDSDMWEQNDIRIDTEVPNQYPNGTTRAALGEHAGDEEHGDDEGH